MLTSRPLAALAAATATALVVGFTPPASAAPYDGKPTNVGARWLSSQLTDGVVHNEQYDFDDWALTIDFALGLDAAGRKQPLVQELATKIGDNVTSYTEPFGDRYAGNLGKAAVLAQVTGRDPSSFGGQDLIAQLEAQVSSTAPIVGRIEDLNVSAFPDSANVFGQAHAARALNTAGSAKAADVTAFLLLQQCSAGFFRQNFTSDKSGSDQSCDSATNKTPSTDTTALAILSLADVDTAAARTAVRKAREWLVDHQRRNGSLSATGKPKGGANANSTGLAGWALGELGRARSASKAAVWLRNLQAGGANPCSGRLAKQTGAIALDHPAYAAGQRDGITKLTQDQWRRASSQALPALLWTPKADGRFTADGPRTATIGKRLRIELSGVAPGERVCVKSGTLVKEFKSGPDARTQVSLKVQGQPGPRTYKVYVGSKRRDVTVQVVR